MALVSFLHTADWQIGAPLTQCGDKAAAVRARRLETAQRVVDLAKEHAVDLILIAGDLFDGHDVDEVDVKRCVNILDELAPTPTFVLPGNHDHLVSGGVWDRSSWKRHGDHVQLLTKPVEVAVGSDVVLYPCPLTQKRSNQDPTAWIPTREPGDDRVRLGVAHGALDVLPDAAANFPIKPDRTAHAGLDYLALGDWHGFMEVGRAIYPGTIEPSGFGEQDPGHVVVVRIDAAGVEPAIEKHRVASLTWKTFKPEVHDVTDVAAVERDIQQAGPRDRLVLRLIPSFPDPVDEDTLTALDTLRTELQDQAFLLRWDESAQPPLPAEMELELPDGALQRVDEALSAVLEGRIPDEPGHQFAGHDRETVALARRMLHRYARKVTQ